MRNEKKERFHLHFSFLISFHISHLGTSKNSENKPGLYSLALEIMVLAIFRFAKK